MLAKRIIPCLDVNAGRVVKGTNFVDLQDAGDPVECAKLYDEQGADELVFLDITASHEKRKTIFDIVNRVAESIFLPFTVGGGIQNICDIEKLLTLGADKISINSQAVKTPELISEGAKKFGSQCMVVAVDAKRNNEKNNWEVYIHGGRNNTHMDAVKWMEQCYNNGAGEILLTSMDKDGTKSGYDLELTSLIADKINIPIIASGGAGTLEHIYDGVTKGKASAVLAASIFHYKTFTISEVKQYLRQKNVPVRY